MDGGTFDPKAMSRLLAFRISDALQKGFSGSRAFGDMGWALRKKPGSNRLLEYETLMEAFYRVKPAMALCGYSVRKFSAAKLRDVLTVHHFALLENHPTPKQRTLRIHSGKLLGQVTFNLAGTAPFHCEIRQRSDAKRLSWSDEKSLGTAIGSVKRKLRELRSIPD